MSAFDFVEPNYEARALVRAMVEDILRHPLRYDDWTFQGLGMLRLPLPGDRRLHIWDPTAGWVKDGGIHTHPWDFVSYVVAGRIVNTRYTETVGVLQPGVIGEPFKRRLIECGPGGKVNKKPVSVRLSAMPSETIPSSVITSMCDLALSVIESE